MTFNYTHKPDRDDVFVRLIDRRVPKDDLLVDELKMASVRYEFYFETSELADNWLGPNVSLCHVICCWNGPPDSEALLWAQKCLNEGWSVSLAFQYRSIEEMLKYRHKIECWKKEFGDRLNFLRPDESNEGKMRVSQAKLVDNAICDTVRIKYVPMCCDKNTVASNLPRCVLGFFQEASRIYYRYKLYARSPSDGYFAVRVGSGFAITATKTNKVAINQERISLVHSYNPKTNNLMYSGRYLPSSDSVEAAVIFSQHPNVSAIIHTHASELFTRNPAFAFRVTVPPMSYGEAELGTRVARELGLSGDGFLIMAEHGEVFAEFSHEPYRLIDSIERWVAEARSGEADGLTLQARNI